MKYFNIMSELIRDVLNYGVFSDRDFRSMLGDPNNPILLELATEFPAINGFQSETSFCYSGDT